MAVDGKAALAFKNFERGKNAKDFGDFLDARVTLRIKTKQTRKIFCWISFKKIKVLNRKVIINVRIMISQQL